MVDFDRYGWAEPRYATDERIMRELENERYFRDQQIRLSLPTYEYNPFIKKAEPKTWLDQAKEMTTVDRRKHYGHPLPNFIRIAIGWIVTFDKVLTPLQVAQGMVTLKMARDVNMYKDDDWVDTIGYSNTVQMMDERMKEMGYIKGIEYFNEFSGGGLAAVLYEILAKHEKQFPKGK